MNNKKFEGVIWNGLAGLGNQTQELKTGWRAAALVVATWIVASTADAAMGRTPGTFDVSSTGSATYQIPIWVPKGPNGIQPNLALAYNSNSGNGTMGPGWSLAGLGAITRCNKTFAQDGNAAPVRLMTDDGYCLNGNRLRLTSGAGTYGIANSTYQTELADFSNITAQSSAGNGPAWFKVQGKDGLTYEYGNSTDSRIMISGASTPHQWLLNKVKDRAGNNYIITYGTGAAGSLGIGVPTTISYTPSSAGSSSYEYTITFGYAQETTAGTESLYVAGGNIADTNRLTSITVAHGATTVRKYSLGYAQSPTTSRYRLTSVTECADSASANCLLPTTIVYQNGVVGVSGAPIASGASCPGTVYRLDAMDINRDGWDDLICHSTDASSQGHWHVSFGTASGFDAFIDPGVTAALEVYFDDFLGDGVKDFLRPSGGVFYRFRWNGASFVATYTGVEVAPPGLGSPSYYLSTDVNGDGLADLVWRNDSGAVYARLNTTTGGSLSFSSTATLIYQGYVNGSTSGFNLGARTTGNGQDKRLDFNGDGRGDLVTIAWSITGTFPYFNYSVATSTLIATSSTFTVGTTLTGQVATAADWNDDECADFVSSDGYMRLSKCNGTEQQLPFVAALSSALPIDWNSDGRQDVMVQSDGYWQVYLATGDGTLQPPISTGMAIGSGFWAISDKDKDGQDDVLFLDTAGGNAVQYRLHNSASMPPDLATSITDGYGVAFNPTYVAIPHSSNYTKVGGTTSPEVETLTPRYVVNQFTASDGIGGTYAKAYAYSGARKDIQGRGFLGFQQVSVSDSRSNSPIVKSYFKTAFPYTGLLHRQDVLQNNGTTLISRTVNTPGLATLDSTTNNQRYFPNIDSSTTDTYEVGGVKNGNMVAQSTVDPTYDSYGNVTNSTRVVTDVDSTSPASPTNGQSWTTTVTNTFTVDAGANWCISIPTQTSTSQYATGVSTITRTVGITPDYANCRVTQQVVEPSSGTYRVTTGYGYDSFGNVNSETVTGVSMSGRQTLIGWGTTGQFPHSVTNALGQVTTAGYRFDLGVQTTLTDPNGIAAGFSHDAFGRVTRETRTDLTYTDYSYTDCAPSNCLNGDPAATLAINKMLVTAIANAEGGAVIRTDYTHLDQFDRPIVTRTQTLGSNSYSRVGTQYDVFGNLLRQTAPCTAGCTVYWTTNTYDALNRLLTQTRPISASNATLQTTSISYQGLTTVTTDPQSKLSTKVVDPNGWLRRSQDHNGYAQLFTYDAYGNVTAVTDSATPSNTLFSATYDYGLRAFQRTTTDVDLGAWTYTPNALGEVTSYTDAKGSTFTQTFDDLSRIETRALTGQNDITFTYGNNAALYNIGQLESIVNIGGTTENYAYNSKGQLVQRRITSDAVYDYNYAYAANGQLDTLTYPTSTGGYRLVLKHQYQYGLLNEVKDNATGGAIFWHANTMNPRGQISNETLGNQVVTARTFDAVTGWVTKIESGVNGGAGLQNESYLWDRVGNLTQRQNNALTLTESFCYDNVYRLVKSARSGDVNCNTSNNLTVGYDLMGNITNRSDVASGATWTYHATKKHAVLQAGNGQPNSGTVTYEYDANGNAVTRNGFGLTWNRYNYPTVINGSGKTLTFSYDANHQRYQQVYTNGSITETTMYIGGLLEKVTIGSLIDYRHYIKVGSQTIAVMSRQINGAATTNTTRYMLEDHQGSVANVLDGTTGASYVAESFTAFGQRRNPADWTNPCPCPDLAKIAGVSRMGYTGHEAIGGFSMGLNHMNGRVQDAITGRFLSADPYITEPGNTQNYNRYSYVYNNPLSFTDPSGFCIGGTKLNDYSPCYDPTGNYYSVYTFGRYDQSAIYIDGVGNVTDLGDRSIFEFRQIDAWSLQGSFNSVTSSGFYQDFSGGAASSSAEPQSQECYRPADNGFDFNDFVNFSAGLGDVLLLGFGDDIRGWLDIGSVDMGSSAYGAGEVTGSVALLATGVAGGIRAAGARGAGMEFSHAVPARMGGPRSIWNGNFVTRETHALSDPFRNRFMSQSWKRANPMPNRASQLWTRTPNTIKGTAAGASAAGAGLAGAGC